MGTKKLHTIRVHLWVQGLIIYIVRVFYRILDSFTQLILRVHLQSVTKYVTYTYFTIKVMFLRHPHPSPSTGTNSSSKTEPRPRRHSSTARTPTKSVRQRTFT